MYLKKNHKRRITKDDWENLVYNVLAKYVKVEDIGSKVVRLEFDDSVERILRQYSKALFGTEKCGISGVLNLALILGLMQDEEEGSCE